MPRKKDVSVDEDFTVGTIEGMDEDFTVGAIAGLGSEELELDTNTTEESVEDMVTMNKSVQTAGDTIEESTSVTLYTKSGALANLIEAKIEGIEVTHADNEIFEVTGSYIRVTRTMAETALGKEISDTQWRMLFMKREGENVTLNDHEFLMGEPSADDTADRRETVQTNVRMEIGVRNDMNKYRELLGLSQNDYILYAITELTAKMKEELDSLL